MAKDIVDRLSTLEFQLEAHESELEAGIVRGAIAEIERRDTRIAELDLACDNLKLQRDEALDQAHRLRGEIERLGTEKTAIQPPTPAVSLQDRINEWVVSCMGRDVADDKVERNHRFLEESLELVQACGCIKESCLALVDYVFGRPIGSPSQEVGGVVVTLSALCAANGINMHDSAELELERVWSRIEAIRAKHFAKPPMSVLPGYARSAAIDPDMPRRFRWRAADAMPGDALVYGVYFPKGDLWIGDISYCPRPGQPDMPVLEWVDPAPKVVKKGDAT
jgi:hypothetical protein